MLPGAAAVVVLGARDGTATTRISMAEMAAPAVMLDTVPPEEGAAPEATEARPLTEATAESEAVAARAAARAASEGSAALAGRSLAMAVQVVGAVLVARVRLVSGELMAPEVLAVKAVRAGSVARAELAA